MRNCFYAVLAALWIPCAFAQRGTGELRLSVKDGTGAGVAATAGADLGSAFLGATTGAVVLLLPAAFGAGFV